MPSILWKHSPIVGAVLWCCCLQFFVAEQIVRYGWTTPYSWTGNFISDLGAVHCANRPIDSHHFVCSPWHALMNASFVLQGLLIAGGAFLMGNTIPGSQMGRVSRLLLFSSGIGVFLVGLAPEDVNTYLHFGGAALHFLAGNGGMILLGFAISRDPNLPRFLGILTITAGAVGLIALILLAIGHPGVLEKGGIERAIAYPLPLCLATIGGCPLWNQGRGKPDRPSAPKCG